MTDDEILRAAAWRIRKHGCPGLDREDAMQEGRIALWLARRSGRVPLDARHAECYLVRRVMGAMLDAYRGEWRQRPPIVGSLDDGQECAAIASAPQPDAIAQARQALARVMRRGSARMLECIGALLDADAEDVAREMGISAGRVSQLRKRAREIAAACY